MTLFYNLLKESHETMRQARAYIDSLVGNAVKLETVLNGEISDDIQVAFIMTTTKEALDKRKAEWEALSVATKHVEEYKPFFGYQEQSHESLLELIRTCQFELSDAWKLLNVMYQEYLQTSV